MHLFATSLLLAAATEAILVPRALGPYVAAVEHFELIDVNRVDRFASKPNTPRRFMASAYIPISREHQCQMYNVPYVPFLSGKVYDGLVAQMGLPAGFLGQFEMDYCNTSTINPQGQSDKKKFPIAIFSPALAMSRLAYGAMARSLASFGYIVLTVDHPHEALFVEFPDGTNITMSNPPLGVGPLNDEGLAIRADDVAFLMSQLSNTTFTSSIFGQFPGTFDPLRVAVYGHSFGGATAAVLARRDSRAIGGADLDGNAHGDELEKGFKDKPFVLASSEGIANSTPGLNWPEFYPKIDASKMELSIKGTQHSSFLDVPLLLEVSQLPPTSPETVGKTFGTLSGKKMERAVDSIMVGVMDLLFRKNSRRLKNIGQNEDIVVVHNDLRGCK